MADDKRLDTLQEEIKLMKGELKQSLARDGTEVSTSRSPEDFAVFLREEAKLWASIVRASGAKSD